MNEELTEEELRILVNNDEIFNEYNLKDIYTVTEASGYLKKCCDCQLLYDNNQELFYHWKYTVCITCSKLRSVNLNKLKKHIKGTKYNSI